METAFQTSREQLLAELKQIANNISSYQAVWENKAKNGIDNFWGTYYQGAVLEIKKILENHFKNDFIAFNQDKTLEMVIKLFENNFNYDEEILEKVVDLLSFYIREVKIKNFRCFQDLHLKGLKLINLVTGKNDTGKTNLLEAIAFAISGQKSYISLRYSLNKSLPNDFLRNCYLNEKKPILLEFFINLQAQSNLYLPQILQSYPFQQEFPVYSANVESSKEFLSYSSNLALLFSIEKSYPEYDLVKIWEENHRLNGAFAFLEAFRIINPDVEEIRTYTTQERTLYLRRKGQKAVPLSHFGDATRKIAQYLVAILELHFGKNGYGLLLIDEIENGLHWTIQQEFWEMLIKLALHYRVQIIATTHSKEMIEALLRATEKNKWYHNIAYFELYKDWETQEIKANDLPLHILERKVERNDNFRGE
ncbi:MAG: AAA family ATPase [Raineya sp.]|nr:AAA family ATPase [Raineya sp.]